MIAVLMSRNGAARDAAVTGASALCSDGSQQHEAQVGLTSLKLSCAARAHVPKPRGARPARSRREQRRERMSGGVPPPCLELNEALQRRSEAGPHQLQLRVRRRRDCETVRCVRRPPLGPERIRDDSTRL